MKTRPRLKVLRQTEEGFSIIEVLAAFSVLAIVTIGTVPLFISGLRGSLVAKLDTQAKNLAQERLDIMRNLPFHLELTNQSEAPVPANCTPPARTDPRTGGSVVCSYRDLMDTYYRSTTAATSATTGGYVDAAAARIADEPANAFYRFVIDPVPGLGNKFRQVVATQFLDVNRVPAAPAADYSSQVVAKDFPKTRLVGVTIITTWKSGQIGKKFVNFTQMAESRVAPSAVVLQSRTIALLITGNIDLTRQLKMVVGSANADGVISAGASGATQVDSAVAEVIPGPRITGFSGGASAPPTSALPDGNQGPPAPQLVDGGVTIAQFANTKARNVAVTISSDQPIVGNGTLASPSLNPVLTRLSGQGPSPKLGFHNLPNALLNPMPELKTDVMIVRMDETSNDDSKTLIEGSAYARSVGGSTHKAIAGSGAFTGVLKIAPTTFAPQGVVQVELNSASLTCEAGGATSSAVADFTATVRVWTYDTASSGLNSGYNTVYTITDGQLEPPLGTGSPLNASTLLTQVGRDALFQPILLNKYIASWGSATGPASTNGATGDAVQRSISGIVSISTMPVRLSDPDSNIGITVGQMSCQTEDHRG